MGMYVGAIRSPSLAGETCPLQIVFAMWYVQFSSVSQSCLTLCNPVDCSTPGLAVLHQILELGKLMSIELVLPSNHLILCHPLSSCLQSCSASGSFQMSHVVTSGGQSIKSFRFSISPCNEYSGLISLGLAGWISLQTKGLSRVFSNTTVQKIISLDLSFLYSPTLTSIPDHWKNHSLD